MIKSVNNYPVSQLFDIDAGVVYAIPRYQREYTWGISQLEDLFDDILENNSAYFIGSIICINQSTDVLVYPQKLELVDGQQRLTALSLLFAAVYHAIKCQAAALNDNHRFEMTKLKYKLVLRKGEDQIRLIPQIQNSNNKDYQAVLAEAGIIGEVDVPAYAGNRKIFRAYRYFQNRIDAMANGEDTPLDAIMQFKDDLKAIHQVPVATRSNMIHVYEKLIDHDARDCLDKIRAAGRMYAVILSRNPDDTLKDLEKPLKDLERIQGAPSYLLLLYLLIHRETMELAVNHLAAVTELCVRFFVRRYLTDMPPTRDLTRLFMAIIDKLADLKGEAVLYLIAGQLAEISASDDMFQEKLEGPIYDENAGVSRFILCALAEQAMTKETWVDLWRIENKKFLWTIEHIFPQGKNLPQSWIDMIGDGDVQIAGDIQQTHVHKLGNLTISGFNSALGNKNFAEKRDRVDRQGRAVGYKNGLKLNQDLAETEYWGKNQIDQRTSRLVDSVMTLFKLQGDVL